MNNQIIINTTSGEINAFLQPGFYQTQPPSKIFHRHNYAEIHVIHGGNAIFHVDSTNFSTEKGNVLIIPGGMYHVCTGADENCRHSAFQIELNVREFSYVNLPDDLLDCFFSELEKCKKNNNHSIVASYLNLFCSYFDNTALNAVAITDYGFLIHEFFTNHYNDDVQLSTLANLLHLSERQTERLVVQYTGNSFREELCQVRITMAKELLKTTDMSLGEICRYVGYRSYAGFWKAMKKYE